LGLIKGEWPICGKVTNWNHVDWPMPHFVRRDRLSKKAWLVRYSDSDPNRIESEVPTTFESELDTNAAWGYGAVQIKLTKLLA
jgi:hypothetical protein